MKLIIAGGRNFSPTKKHIQMTSELLELEKVSEVVSGGASGADSFGEKLATEKSIKLQKRYVRW